MYTQATASKFLARLSKQATRLKFLNWLIPAFAKVFVEMGTIRWAICNLTTCSIFWQAGICFTHGKGIFAHWNSAL